MLTHRHLRRFSPLHRRLRTPAASSAVPCCRCRVGLPSKVLPVRPQYRPVCSPFRRHLRPSIAIHTATPAAPPLLLLPASNSMPRTEPGSVLLWTRDVENAFVDLLVATFRQYNSLSWKTKDWNDMSFKLHRDHNFIASIDKLQHKFQRLKSSYKKFEHLLNHTGFGWDPALEIVTCPEDVRLKFMAKRGYPVLLQQGFPHYTQLHEILRGRLAIGGMAMDSANPPTPAQLHAMEESYIGNQTNRRAGKEPMPEPQESEGSSDSPPPSAAPPLSAQRNLGNSRRRKAGELRSDPIMVEALDILRTYTNSMSPSVMGTTKKSKSVSSPQKSDTEACMELATAMEEHLSTDEYVDLIMLMRDEFNRKAFLTLAGTIRAPKIANVKSWINKAVNWRG